MQEGSLVEAGREPGLTCFVRIGEAGMEAWSFGFETPLTHLFVCPARRRFETSPLDSPAFCGARRWIRFAARIAGRAVLSGVAVAGIGIGSPPPSFGAPVIEEVLVTARKREESVQDTPVSVSAFSSRELEARQIHSSDRLGEVAPNLTFDPAGPYLGSHSAAQVFMRGIGQSDFTPVTDPGVGLYVDGIYMARSPGNVTDFVDIERIEVLRGPQGVVFGRNTIGGAIAVHTRRPAPERSASLAVRFGDGERRDATAKWNGPLRDGLLASAAVATRHRRGHVERAADGLDLGDTDRASARGAMLWDGPYGIENYTTLDATRIRENGSPTVSGGVNDRQSFATFGNALLDTCRAVSINPGYPDSGPPTYPPPGTGSGGAGGCYGPDSVPGKTVNEGTFPVRSDLDIAGIGNELTWRPNALLTVTAVSGYRAMHVRTSRDADNTPANILATRDDFRHRQFSQELRVAGTGARLDWQAGVYYFHERGRDETELTVPVGSAHMAGAYRNDAHAAFVQIMTDIGDSLALTAGGRYSVDEKRFEPDMYALGDASQSRGSPFGPTWPKLAGVYLTPAGPFASGERIMPAAESGETYGDFTWNLSLARHWGEHRMGYVSVATGFKSGGFDMRYVSPTPPDPVTGVSAPTTFDPETALSVEIGLKSRWFGSRLLLNAAVFQADYERLQVIVRESFNPQTYNGGSARVRGAEVEMTWLPGSAWRSTFALGYMAAGYRRLSASVLNNATPILPGYRLANTPRLGFALGLSRVQPVGSWGTLTPRLDWSYHGKQFNDAINSPQLVQAPYHLLSAALRFEGSDGRWEADLWLRNLTGRRHLITGNSGFGTSAAYVEQVWSRGFEWSVEVRRNFD